MQTETLAPTTNSDSVTNDQIDLVESLINDNTRQQIAAASGLTLEQVTEALMALWANQKINRRTGNRWYRHATGTALYKARELYPVDQDKKYLQELPRFGNEMSAILFLLDSREFFKHMKTELDTANFLKKLVDAGIPDGRRQQLIWTLETLIYSGIDYTTPADIEGTWVVDRQRFDREIEHYDDYKKVKVPLIYTRRRFEIHWATQPWSRFHQCCPFKTEPCRARWGDEVASILIDCYSKLMRSEWNSDIFSKAA